MEHKFQVIQKYDRDKGTIYAEVNTREAALEEIESACKDAADLMGSVEFFIKEVYRP